MKILTAAQLRDLDRRSTEAFGIPGLLLMENAGIRVVEALEARIGDIERQSVAILCGKGNNGGDGFVVARQLIQRGCLPSVFLFASPEAVRGDARANLDILTRIGHPPAPVADFGEWRREVRDLGQVDIVVDALLGTGLSGPVEGLLGEVIATLGDDFPEAVIVSVDLPSGCLADTGKLSGPAVEADLTVTFGALKHCLVFPPANGQAGDVVIADIGNPHSLVDSPAHQVELLIPDSFPDVCRVRDPDTHKGDYGKILIVGGSTGMTGAPAMTGEAALRSGAGLVTVASARSAVPAIAAHMPELMTLPLPETTRGSCAAEALADPFLGEMIDSASLLVVGPGMGRHSETTDFIRRLVARVAVPTLIDADGLYAFRGHTDELDGGARPLVITPHAGEMAGLLGSSPSEVVEDRLEAARDFARRCNLYVVLKGYRTIVAVPDGRVFVNSTGNAAMATAGSGDVLTGIIAALLGQPYLGGFEERLCLAVYLHGLAGDIGAEVQGEETLTATDLVSFLPDAWERLRGDSED